MSLTLMITILNEDRFIKSNLLSPQMFFVNREHNSGDQTCHEDIENHEKRL